MISVVIPTLNEAKNIPTIIKESKKLWNLLQNKIAKIGTSYENTIKKIPEIAIKIQNIVNFETFSFKNM